MGRVHKTRLLVQHPTATCNESAHVAELGAVDLERVPAMINAQAVLPLYLLNEFACVVAGMASRCVHAARDSSCAFCSKGCSCQLVKCVCV